MRLLCRNRAMTQYSWAARSNAHTMLPVRSLVGRLTYIKIRFLRSPLEHNENAVRARSLECASVHGRAAATDRADRPDAHRGHQFAGCIHLPNRAVPGTTATVTFGSEITRLWRLNGSSKSRKELLSQPTEQRLYSISYRLTPRFRRGFHRHSTGTFGTEIKATPRACDAGRYRDVERCTGRR
jgi:hypothetical protein